MHSNLTEEQARVVLERLESPDKPLVADERQLLSEASMIFTRSILSSAATHQQYLVNQGMHPHVAAQHVRHRFGVL